MIRYSKQTDERREAGPVECWCLHGAVGTAADWRGFGRGLATRGMSTRAVDLWRFLEEGPMSAAQFGLALNAEAASQPAKGGRLLLGYSMGGRLALHALLAKPCPWAAAVIVSAHPGLMDEAERDKRRAADSTWAARALAGNWADFIIAWNAQPVLAGESVRDVGESARLVSRRTEIARSFVDWSLGMQEPLWERLQEVEMPVLWVAGERDGKFLRLAEEAVSRIPSGRLAVAPAAGHRVPWEAEEWLVAEVAGWFGTGK